MVKIKRKVYISKRSKLEKMDCLADSKSEIQNTFTNIRNFSFKEKKESQQYEEKVNSFLDQLNIFKKELREKTSEIYEINSSIEKLTWYSNLDEECLMAINDLISSAKDLRSSLIRQYVAMNKPFKSRGIAKEEIKDFKNSIDELREVYEDLESVFFSLPEMPEFVETTKKLSHI